MFAFLKENKLLFLMILTIGVVAGVLITTNMDILPKGKAASDIKPAVQQVQGELDIRDAFVRVADEVGPAVVSITITRVQKVGGVRRFYFGPFGGGERKSPFDDDFFNDFFRDFFRDIPEREYKQMGMGSGVIIDKDGFVLTNEHVIADADKITVTLSDGREFEGEVKGRDPRRDLAVIKINAKELPVAKLGDSDLVQTGEWVVAIGNPFGHLVNSPEPTVTVGVVSALHRSLPMGPQEERIYVDLIQTDAAINPGNSGGPLCDLNGNVVGINVAIFSTTGGYQGVGFAIPINTARLIIDDLIKGEEVLYGWLGVSIQDINQDMADYFELEKRQGALVTEVVKGGPAEKGGLKGGDIITSFNGKDIIDVRDLLRKVSTARVGEAVKIGLIRDKKTISVNVKVGKRPTDLVSFEKVEKKDKVVTEAEQIWRGIRVRNITDEIAQHLNIKNKEGVIIEKIEANSPGHNAGLREREVIREINRIPIKHIEDFNKVTENIKGNALVRTDKGYIIVKETLHR